MAKGNDPNHEQATLMSSDDWVRPPRMTDADIAACRDRHGCIRLWLDDDARQRTPPPGWVWVDNVTDAIAVIEANLGRISHMSLDNDLGDDDRYGTGYELVKWMAEQHHGPRAEPRVWPTQGIRVHSANGVGARNMLGTIERYSPFGRPRGRRFGDWDGQTDRMTGEG